MACLADAVPFTQIDFFYCLHVLSLFEVTYVFFLIFIFYCLFIVLDTQEGQLHEDLTCALPSTQNI